LWGSDYVLTHKEIAVGYIEAKDIGVGYTVKTLKNNLIGIKV
jgi:hypothetical protein